MTYLISYQSYDRTENLTKEAKTRDEADKLALELQEQGQENIIIEKI